MPAHPLATLKPAFHSGLAPSPSMSVPGADTEQWLRGAVDASPDCIYLLDSRSMKFVDVNRTASRRLGYRRQRLLAMGPNDICPGLSWRPLLRRVNVVLQGGRKSAALHAVERGRDGTEYPVKWILSAARGLADPCVVVVSRRLRRDRRRGDSTEHGDCRSAARDPLTRLPQRCCFQGRLQQALDRAWEDPAYAFAVLFVDLDRFKAVNDTYGHVIGDRLLRAVARRLAGCVRPGDVVARRDGDEFTVLVDHLREDADAVAVARRICRRLDSPIRVQGLSLSVTASVGIASSRHGYQRTEDLIADADRAMYEAKRAGPGRYVVFDGR